VAPSDPGDERRGLLPTLALLFVLGLVLRLPVLGLPLAGESAALATRAARMGAETAWGLDAVDHRGPLLPLLLAVPTAAGASPTAALRAVDALLGALLAPLACALALALGLGRRTAGWAGVLLTAHPLLALGAGGALAGTGALATALLLSGLLLLGRDGPRGRRVGLLLVLLLPLAEPPCLVYLPFLVALWSLREPSRRWRIAGLVLAVAALAATPLAGRGVDGSVGARLLACATLWVPAACLVGLLPFLPWGLAATWRTAGRARWVARAWLGGAALHVLLLLLLRAPPGFAFGWEGLVTGMPLVPLAVLLGVHGLERLAPARRRTVVRGVLGVGLAASVFLVVGPLETWLLPGATPPAGRLWRLGRVVAAAGEAAGATGWVAFDVAPVLDAYEVKRLGDRLGDRRSGPLDALPLSDLADDLAIVTRYRPQVLDVVTLGGRGIYRQAAVLRLGPWLVLRASRP
jgi:hypothetical protein